MDLVKSMRIETEKVFQGKDPEIAIINDLFENTHLTSRILWSCIPNRNRRSGNL